MVCSVAMLPHVASCQMLLPHACVACGLAESLACVCVQYAHLRCLCILALRPRCGGGGISSRGGQELGEGPTAQHVCRGMSTHKYTYTRIADIERVRASE